MCSILRSNRHYVPEISVFAASSVTKFSFSIGAGINAYLTERIGVRFDARAFGTRTGDRQEDFACGVFGCVTFERLSTFWQSHFVGALTLIAKSSKHENAKQPHWAQARSSCWGTRSPPL